MIREPHPGRTKRVRPAVSVALAAVVVSLALAPAAVAKVWFMSVRGETYGVGATVRTEIAGCPNPCPVRGIRVALAPADALRLVRPVGVVDSRGGLRFRVPMVPPGKYSLVARGRRVSDAFRIVHPS